MPQRRETDLGLVHHFGSQTAAVGHRPRGPLHAEPSNARPVLVELSHGVCVQSQLMRGDWLLAEVHKIASEPEPLESASMSDIQNTPAASVEPWLQALSSRHFVDWLQEQRVGEMAAA